VDGAFTNAVIPGEDSIQGRWRGLVAFPLPFRRRPVQHSDGTKWAARRFPRGSSPWSPEQR